jgi:hypothetical protein
MSESAIIKDYELPMSLILKKGLSLLLVLLLSLIILRPIYSLLYAFYLAVFYLGYGDFELDKIDLKSPMSPESKDS